MIHEAKILYSTSVNIKRFSSSFQSSIGLLFSNKDKPTNAAADDDAWCYTDEEEEDKTANGNANYITHCESCI